MTDNTSAAVPFAFRAPLSVCMDVRHPLAYLTLGPVLALADEMRVAVDWLPFPVPPAKGPPPPADDRGTRHRRARAAYQASEIARYAEVQGLTIEQPFRTGDATPAALAHLWLRAHAAAALPEYLQRLFEGYWNGTLDAADPTAIAAVLWDLEQDDAAFLDYSAGPGPGALAELRAALVAAGVFTVPTLVVEDEVLVGRAHLPMVRWLLRGREGPPPI